MDGPTDAVRGGLDRSPVLLLLSARRTATTMVQALHAAGFAAETGEDERAGLEAAAAGELRAVVVDLRRSGLDLAAFVDELNRAAPDVPVVAITPDELRDYTAACLRGHRDDYLVTPFRVEELVSRLRLRTRAQRPAAPAVARWGTISVDSALGLASRDGVLLNLSRTEFAVLAALVRQRGRTVSRERLAALVWGRRPASNLVEVYIGYLRRKLGPDVIRTVRGMGYVLDEPAAIPAPRPPSGSGRAPRQRESPR
jgi:two-component system response regulator QseB